MLPIVYISYEYLYTYISSSKSIYMETNAKIKDKNIRKIGYLGLFIYKVFLLLFINLSGSILNQLRSNVK